MAGRRSAENGLAVVFLPGDAHALPFADRSFDVVVSLRMLMHTPDWRRCLAEMCRVACRRLIFDYPPLVSFAALQTASRKAAQLVGRRVEAYHVLRTGAVRSVLHANGFEVVKMDRQFVLPIAFHKWIGSTVLLPIQSVCWRPWVDCVGWDRPSQFWPRKHNSLLPIRQLPFPILGSSQDP